MNKKRITLALLATLSASQLAIANDDAIHIKNCGNDITLEKPPERILTLGYTGLAFLASVDGMDKVIGRAVEYGEPVPKWIGDKADNTKIIADNGISLEKIIKLNPDLVYGGGFNTSNRSPDILNEKGVKAVVDEPECHYFYPKKEGKESFNDLFNEMTRLSKLVGTEETTKKTIADLRHKLSEVEKKANKNMRTVTYGYYYGLKDKSLFSYGDIGVIKDINKTLGLKVAIDPNYHPHAGGLATDAFVKSDPDILILLVGKSGVDKKTTMQRLREIPGFNEMRAVKSNSIYFTNGSLGYASPGAMYQTLDLAKEIFKDSE